MIIIEKILGNVLKDPIWQERKADAEVDILKLDQREAQKSRCRKHSENGQDLGIALDRQTLLSNGDVILFDEVNRKMIIVEISLRDVLVIDLSYLQALDTDAQVKASFELGHALGNQHWKAVLKENHVYVPLAVSRDVMSAMMRTHHFQEESFQFVPGDEILPKMSQSEARLLFGGSEETDTHVHVPHNHHDHDHTHTHALAHHQDHHGHDHSHDADQVSPSDKSHSH